MSESLKTGTVYTLDAEGKLVEDFDYMEKYNLPVVPNEYKSLNDAVYYEEGLEAGDTEIWYLKVNEYNSWDFTRKADHGIIDNLEKTHIHLGSIKEIYLESIFVMMQGENWSPEGQARGLIRSKELYHTSMSIGDIIKIKDDVYMVDSIGFKKLN